MASLRAASSQASQQEINELMSEIAFQKVLLSSIDDSMENREDAEAEVLAEIKTLEKRLRNLRRGVTSASPSTTSASLQPLASRPTSSKPHSDTTMDEFSTTSSQNGYQARDQWHDIALNSSTSSTPNSTDSPGEMIGSSKMTLPSRKRSHSKHLGAGLAPFEDNKSRRTSPSPYLTVPTTPDASSGDEDFEMFDNMFNQHQKDIEDRIRQEKADEELAKSLQASNPVNTASTSRPTVPSAFDRLTGMRPQPASYLGSMNSAQNSRTGSSRTLPWATKNLAPTVKPKPRTMASNGEREESSRYGKDSGSHALSSNNRNSFKTSPSRTMPGAFGDDSSTASDSDIEIIPPEAFQDNGRHSTPATSVSGSVYGGAQSRVQLPGFSPVTQIAGDAALRRAEQTATNNALQMAMYGTSNVPNWLNSTLPLPNSFQTDSMLGSYPRPTIGTSNNGAYGTPQAYGGGNFTYPSTGLGDGVPSGNNGGMYSGFRVGSMQNSRHGLGYALTNVAARIIGNGYNIYQPGTSQGLGGNVNLNPFVRPTNERMGEQYDYIMNDPRKTNEEIKELLENIRPDAELPPEDREGTPDGLVYPLYEHQKLALTWMKSMEEGTNKGGILADDMGLGKTISTLALILSRPSNDRARKTTLIVGPVALVRQWEREIRSKVTVSHRLSVRMITQGKKVTWDDIRTFDVVLTTYGILGAEFKRWEQHMEKRKLEGQALNHDEPSMRKNFPLFGPKSLFYRVILDEAQCIKNKTTLAARASKHLVASTRFCLTGTPMMNNVGELYSLIHFLRIKPYNEWTRFQEAFGMLTKGDASRKTVQDAMRKLQAVLKAILLRRTKTSLIDGKPIINLPPKSEEIQHVVFSPDEQQFYNSLESKTQIQFNKYLRTNTVGKNYSNVLVLLLRLRQACCHPHLIMDFEEAPPAGVDLTVEGMMELAKSLAPDVVGRLLAAEGFECPVCYDGVENPSIVIPCGHDTCAECLSKISDQANLQNVAEGNDSNASSKCPTCRGKIDLKKIIDYATFKKVHKPDEVSEQEAASVDGDSETQSGSETESDSDSETESDDDADKYGDLRDFVVPNDIEDTEDDEEDEDGDVERPSTQKSKSKKTKKDKRRKSKKGKDDDPKQHISLAMLKKEASRSAEGRRRYMRYLRKNWQTSAKVDKCVELIEKFQNEGQKTIIFSQFVSLLDLLQVPIDENHWKCERYDGAMNADARNNAILRFTEQSNIKIMLISLKAGNAGLNLTTASRVIILDPFWNPFIEMQAVDRAYRIGQQNSVQVHRILIKATVEDRIVELQERKRKLVDSALDEGASKSLGRLNVNQLSYLFGVGGVPE